MFGNLINPKVIREMIDKDIKSLPAGKGLDWDESLHEYAIKELLWLRVIDVAEKKPRDKE